MQAERDNKRFIPSETRSLTGKNDGVAEPIAFPFIKQSCTKHVSIAYLSSWYDGANGSIVFLEGLVDLHSHRTVVVHLA